MKAGRTIQAESIWFIYWEGASPVTLVKIIWIDLLILYVS